jgi:ribosomal protein S24E
VKEELARVLKCKTEMIFIMKMETKGGTWRTVGEVHVYDQPENAKKFVPRYIQARAMKPKEG